VLVDKRIRAIFLMVWCISVDHRLTPLLSMTVSL
jgi:hypothetical protein